MPHEITPAYCHEHRGLFHDARLIVANEFRALDGHEQYYNAFARLLKRDPLGRVAMLGTDQRDQFVPVLRELVGMGGKPGRILDVGCGDGQTFALIHSAVPEGSTIDLIDPNAEYVDAYAARIEQMPNVALGEAHAVAYVPDPDDTIYAPPLAAAYDLILSIHSLYFFDDLGACIEEIYARLAPGGTAIIVFADESISYTGVCYRAWQRHLGRPDLADAHAALCQERLNWLRGSAKSLPLAVERLASGGQAPDIKVLPQQTRLYGHTLSEVIALCNIAGLSLDEDIAKFAVAADVLEQHPVSVGFRIEDDPESPRLGMFSVLQPQIVCAITRPR